MVPAGAIGRPWAGGGGGRCRPTIRAARHIAYARPTCRPRDWEHYRSVNERFSQTVLEEVSGPAAVWIHDYHLALVPRLLRSQRPDITLAHFWHIPWPVPEC